MSQQYFSDSEWSTLMQAPTHAMSAVILADKSDPVSFLKEVRTALQILDAEQQRTDFTSDLGRSLMQGLRDRVAAASEEGNDLLQQKMFEYLLRLEQLKNSEEGRKASLAHLQQVSSILASKVTIVQSREFSDWLIGLARKVAEAVKEEGLWGIGGERISRPEASTLAEIEKALKV